MPKIQLITDGHPNNTTLIIDGVDVTSEEDLIKLVDAEFLKESEARFHAMAQSLINSQQRNEIF